jgi:hypothetical protein
MKITSHGGRRLGTGKYIMTKEKEIKPATLHEWGCWLESDEGREIRQVRSSHIGDHHVSTVFMGLDHSFGSGPPLLFETMIFTASKKSKLDHYQTRSATWESALGHHAAACDLVHKQRANKYWKFALWVCVVWAAYNLFMAFAKASDTHDSTIHFKKGDPTTAIQGKPETPIISTDETQSIGEITMPTFHNYYIHMEAAKHYHFILDDKRISLTSKQLEGVLNESIRSKSGARCERIGTGIRSTSKGSTSCSQPDKRVKQPRDRKQFIHHRKNG